MCCSSSSIWHVQLCMCCWVCTVFAVGTWKILVQNRFSIGRMYVMVGVSVVCSVGRGDWKWGGGEGRGNGT